MAVCKIQKVNIFTHLELKDEIVEELQKGQSDESLEEIDDDTPLTLKQLKQAQAEAWKNGYVHL